MSKQEQYFERTAKSANTFLARWRDGEGQLLELTRGHKSLRILLTKSGAHGNLMISCLDPQFVRSAVSWKDDPLAVALVAQAGAYPLFKIHSSSDAIEIISGGLEVAENIKLR